MMEKLKYSPNINVIVKKKRIKKMYLRVSSKDASVNISAPIGIPDKIIKEFIEKNIEWIQKKQARILADREKAEKPLEAGSEVYIWGKAYKIAVRNAVSNVIILRDDTMLVYTRQADGIELVIEKWLRRKLMEKITDRAAVWETVVGKQASEYAVRKMVRCWGNCRPTTGRITINLEIVHRPEECLDYVLVHELVHFHEIYHNKRFWSLVEKFYPNWKLTKNLLKNWEEI